MAAPVVQSLADIMAQLEQAYTPSRQLYQSQIDAIPGQTQQQITGLDAAKTNAFTDINTGANSRGMAFSGVPVAEQSRYLGEKYLPAVANVQSTANNTKNTLLQNLSSLYTDQYTKALSTHQGQQSALDSYNDEIRKEQFQAQQAALDRQASAASRSSSAGDSAAAQLAADRASLAQELGGVTGRDGYVSPESYNKAKNAWVAGGYSAADFDKYYASFRNPKNPNYFPKAPAKPAAKAPAPKYGYLSNKVTF